MKVKKCAFTGHRPQSLPFGFNESDERCIALKQTLRAEIIRLIEQEGVTHFISGMALGVDTVSYTHLDVYKRQDQWVAKAKALWGQGNDVLVTQPGEDGRQETVKHLLAEDYIPVGTVMDMDGKTVRVDKVDFQNEEVSLTDITDRKNPVPFRERLSIVRSYVEDAPAESLWEAMDRREHTSQKKPLSLIHI